MKAVAKVSMESSVTGCGSCGAPLWGESPGHSHLFLTFLICSGKVSVATGAASLRVFFSPAEGFNLVPLFLLSLPRKNCTLTLVTSTSFPYLSVAYKVLHHKDTL